MANKNKRRGIYWVIFITAVSMFGYAIYDRWTLTMLILPFIVTSFAKAMDII